MQRIFGRNCPQSLVGDAAWQDPIGCPKHPIEVAMDTATLLSLPFPTLFVLASGFVGYRLAYAGRAKDHKSVDVVFFTAVFGFIAKAEQAAVALIAPEWVAYLAGVLLTVCVALLWRGWLQEHLFDALRHFRLTNNDGFHGVWESLLARPMGPVKQIVVRLKSGRHLLCDRCADFDDAPLGPGLFGEDGSVALYVTHVRDPGETEWFEMTPHQPDFGYAMTFVRADVIQDVEILR
ncbi:MAG: hypothetical protein R3D60_13030 [Paracoccaceae bacterium]